MAPYEVRDFIRNYVEDNCKLNIVLQFFKSKISSLLADKQLENLKIKKDDFSRFEQGIQLVLQ